MVVLGWIFIHVVVIGGDCLLLNVSGVCLSVWIRPR